MACPKKQENPRSGAVHITIGRPEGISQEVKKYLVACGVIRGREGRKAS